MSTAWNAFPMLDRLLDDVMTGVAGTSLGAAAGAASHARGFTPSIDVRANNDEIVFTVDVPGIKRDDLDVTLEDGVLTIKGQRRYEGSGKDKVWLGRSYGSFERSFTLPETVDPERLSAELADGVLTVRVAQTPKLKPRKITIGVKDASPPLGEARDEASKVTG